LSARAAHELSAERALAKFRNFLEANDLYVFTINGFPYGAFHDTRVKENVYRPDWHEPERAAYTILLIDLLANLLPLGDHGTISTVPIAFRERGTFDKAIMRNLGRCLQRLGEVEVGEDKDMMVALEPEPSCMLETIEDAIAFFDQHIENALNLGICLDACHAAVEFEDLSAGLAKLRAANIPIAKLQLSSGLRVAP